MYVDHYFNIVFFTYYYLFVDVGCEMGERSEPQYTQHGSTSDMGFGVKFHTTSTPVSLVGVSWAGTKRTPPTSPAREVTSELSPMDTRFVVEHDEDSPRKRARLDFGAMVDTPAVLHTKRPNGEGSTNHTLSFSCAIQHAFNYRVKIYLLNYVLADVLGKTTKGALLVQKDVEMGKQEGQQHDGTNALASLSEPQKSIQTIQIPSSLLAQLLNPKRNAQLQILLLYMLS